jgi:RHS repeat-associated protein
MVSAASRPTLAKNARMGHPLFITGKEEQTPEKAGPPAEFDPETGLNYNRARYYNPTSGRFISEDPIKFKGGINFYSYVKNNAVDWSDPDGKGMSGGTLATIWNGTVNGLSWIKCSITASYCLTGLQGLVNSLNMANYNAPPSQTYDTLLNTADATHNATGSSLYLNQACAANHNCMAAFESCGTAGQANPLPTPPIPGP